MAHTLRLGYYPDVLSEAECDQLYQETVARLTEFKKLPTNKRININYGVKGLSYSVTFYGKTIVRPITDWEDWPLLLKIKAKVEEVTGGNYKYVVIQFYPHGDIGIPAHRDKEITPGKTIAGLSIGACRTLTMKRYGYGAKSQDLMPGSVYAMYPPTNDWWTHEIEEDDTVEPRISFTFREEP